MTEDIAIIANYLKDQRITQGLSQRELAHKVGVSHDTIRFIEGGRRQPSLRVFLDICNALSVEVSLDAAQY